jgi:hypothetical protein
LVSSLNVRVLALQTPSGFRRRSSILPFAGKGGGAPGGGAVQQESASSARAGARGVARDGQRGKAVRKRTTTAVPDDDANCPKQPDPDDDVNCPKSDVNCPQTGLHVAFET